MASSPLHRLLSWTKLPLIIGAPMRVISGPQLAVEISKAGGLGFIGPGASPEDLEHQLSEARRLLDDAENLREYSRNTLPIGVGFQTWAGDLEVASRCLKRNPPAAVWLFAPRHGQKEFDEWIREIRSICPATSIWIQVASVADAVASAQSEQKPDVLVIQGADAGGHSLVAGAGLITLLPEVADTLADRGHGDIPLVAAGGIIDSRGAAAALTLGAAGIVMGTRFLASTEATISRGYQTHVLQAQDGGQTTVKTQLYNHLRGTMDWPPEFSPRGLANQSWRDKQAGVEFDELKRRHDAAVAKGDAAWGEEGRTATYVGTGVGLVRDVQDSAQIVRDTREGIAKVIEAAKARLNVEA